MKTLIGVLIAVACVVAWSSETKIAAAEPERKIIEKKDVVYGMVKGAGLLAEIAYPADAGTRTVILAVHGGRWVGGHRGDKSAIVPAEWAGRGFFAMTIDYRLKECTPAPACYQDLLCAIRWVHGH